MIYETTFLLHPKADSTDRVATGTIYECGTSKEDVRVKLEKGFEESKESWGVRAESVEVSNVREMTDQEVIDLIDDLQG